MAERIVINTGPLIALARMGALDIGAQLPYEFICPLEVKDELDDGAALIKGELIDLHGLANLRARYLTPYAFVLAPGGSPINNGDFDELLERHLKAILLGEGTLEELATAVGRLPRRDQEF